MKRTKTNIIILAVIVFLVSVDQVIKVLVDSYLKPVGEITVIPDIIRFRYLENDGAMMGFMDGKTSVMTILAIICFGGVVVLIFSGKIQNKVDLANFVLISAGGLGNIIDRIFRGYVIDYIDVLFVDFYVFNFADCLITVGAFLLFFNQIYQIYKEHKDKKTKVQND
ncbi:MAG: signal peptidase II [Acutalibacteraceae bacterium]|nr:signal peptidase II [Acutalibacteraceae bacterium]